MAKEALTTLSGEASADLSASQFTFVRIDTSGEIAVAGAGEEANGILQDKPTAQGMACSYGIGGVSKVRAGAAIGDGVKVASDATGRAVTATTGDFVLGWTRTVAGAADEVIEMIFQPQDISA